MNERGKRRVRLEIVQNARALRVAADGLAPYPSFIDAWLSMETGKTAAATIPLRALDQDPDAQWPWRMIAAFPRSVRGAFWLALGPEAQANAPAHLGPWPWELRGEMEALNQAASWPGPLPASAIPRGVLAATMPAACERIFELD